MLLLVYVLDNTACVIMEYFSSFAKFSFGSSIMAEYECFGFESSYF